MGKPTDMTRNMFIHVHNADSDLMPKYSMKPSQVNLPERITDRHQDRDLWFP